MQKQLPRTISTIAVVVMVAMSASPAFGGAWTIPSGNTDSLGGALNYSYSNGGDVNGLFNDPFILGNAFFFSTSFSSAAVGVLVGKATSVVRASEKLRNRPAFSVMERLALTSTVPTVSIE